MPTLTPVEREGWPTAPSQAIIQLKDLEVDCQRYKEWKDYLRRNPKRYAKAKTISK